MTLTTVRRRCRVATLVLPVGLRQATWTAQSGQHLQRWPCAPGSSLCRDNLNRDAYVSRTHVCVETICLFLASFPETAEKVQSSRYVLKHSFCACCVIFAIVTPSRKDGKVCFPTFLSVMFRNPSSMLIVVTAQGPIRAIGNTCMHPCS